MPERLQTHEFVAFEETWNKSEAKSLDMEEKKRKRRAEPESTSQPVDGRHFHVQLEDGCACWLTN